MVLEQVALPGVERIGLGANAGDQACFVGECQRRDAALRPTRSRTGFRSTTIRIEDCDALAFPSDRNPPARDTAIAETLPSTVANRTAVRPPPPRSSVLPLDQIASSSRTTRLSGSAHTIPAGAASSRWFGFNVPSSGGTVTDARPRPSRRSNQLPTGAFMRAVPNSYDTRSSWGLPNRA